MRVSFCYFLIHLEVALTTFNGAVCVGGGGLLWLGILSLFKYLSLGGRGWSNIYCGGGVKRPLAPGWPGVQLWGPSSW